MFDDVKDSDWSAEHVARHGVTLDEAREVIRERPYWTTTGKNDSILIMGAPTPVVSCWSSQSMKVEDSHSS